jgi:C4-dicarboxylate transporter DctM subunit
MNPVTISYIGIGFLLLAFLLRMPVAFAMMGVGFVGMLFLLPSPAALNYLALDVYSSFSSFPFSAITLFILMGYYASMSGITTRLYKTAYVWVGQLRGGLSIATILACAAFASMCGSSPAEVATMGKIAYPEMKKYGYNDALATGSIAGAGTLGPLIPPSNGFIVYGLLTEQSIGRLFISGVIPGILLMSLFAVTVFLMCQRNPRLGPAGPKTGWGEKFRTLPGVAETAAVFLLVIGGLFAGFFTPTQAGGVGAAGALLVGLARKTISLKGLWAATKESLIIATMVFALVTGAVVFGHFLTMSTLPMLMMSWAQALPVSPYVVLGIVCLFYLVGGCFIDALGLIVLTIPIIAPVMFELGFDPIWFGVIIVLLSETGVITPPVGVNVFVMKALAPDVPIGTIFRGIVPFFVAVCAAIILIIIFPSIATFLPSFTSY